MESRVNYGQEFGKNLIKICKKLLDNQNLCKLLVNTDLDPLNKNLHPDFEDTMELFGTNLRVVPLIEPADETTTSKIVIVYGGSDTSFTNTDNETLSVLIYIYTPFKEWILTGDQIRPFAIMSEIRKSLQDKKINGLGEIKYEGFDLSTLTNQTGSYLMRFSINAFN